MKAHLMTSHTMSALSSHRQQPRPHSQLPRLHPQTPLTFAPANEEFHRLRLSLGLRSHDQKALHSLTRRECSLALLAGNTIAADRSRRAFGMWRPDTGLHCSCRGRTTGR